MRQALAISWIQFKMTVKSKGALAMMFFMPLILTLIFGVFVAGSGSTGSSGDGQVYPVTVADGDGTFAARKLVEALRQEPTLRLTVSDAAQLDKAVSDRSAYVGIVIPAGYQKGLNGGAAPEVQIVTLPGSNAQLSAGQTIRKATAHASGDYLLARQMTGDSADEAKLAAAYTTIVADRQAAGATVNHQRLKRETPQVDTGYTVATSALGFTVMFVMMLVFSMSSSILTERENGTWGRILTTPTPRIQVLIGFLLSFFITGLFQFTVLVAATMAFFNVQWGPLLPLFGMASVFILCSAALGLFLAGIVKTADQQKTIGMVVVIATSMLGGVYWPLEYMSPTMQKIGYLTPQAWAMEGFREVMLRGGSWAGLALPMVVLGALALIFMTAGLLRVRYE
ncbi:MAG TPA: ABC transporter permease [Symbiobacteriaceae bacterium]|jgi:ABC-2 type transport system permease protein